MLVGPRTVTETRTSVLTGAVLNVECISRRSMVQQQRNNQTDKTRPSSHGWQAKSRHQSSRDQRLKTSVLEYFTSDSNYQCSMMVCCRGRFARVLIAGDRPRETKGPARAMRLAERSIKIIQLNTTTTHEVVAGRSYSQWGVSQENRTELRLLVHPPVPFHYVR